MTTGSTITGINTGTNWKNVNNWHWVEKNVFPWAKEYMSQKLVGLSASHNGTNVSLKSLKDMSGDVDLNQRKGKIITIYDIAMTFEWDGLTADEKGASGKLVLPELMHDTDLDDLVFEITTDSEKPCFLEAKDVVRKHLMKVIRDQLKQFQKDLIDAHHKDVYIPKEEMKGHPVLEAYQPKPPAPSVSSTTSSGKKGVLGSLVTLNQKVEFVASASDLFNTLLDAKRVQIWTRSGSANIKKEAGSEFSLFNGNVSGRIVSLNEPKELVMKWRLKSWPEGHFSTVNFKFEEGDEYTIVRIEQKDVPVGEKDTTEANWKNYYWNPIKSAFGYGALL